MPSRHRETNDIVLQPGVRTISVWNGTPATNTSKFQGASLGAAQIMNDTVTPGFKKMVRDGAVLNNYMDNTKFLYSAALTGYEHTYQGVPQNGSTWKDDFSSLLNWKLGPLLVWIDGNVAPPVPLVITSQSEINTLRNEAATNALAQFNSSSVQGIVFLKELQSTLDTLIHPLAALADMVSKARKHGWGGQVIAHGAASQYLTYLYGIRATMTDIEGILQALDKKYYERTTSRGSATTGARTVVSNGLLLHQGAVLVDSRYKVEVKETYTVRAGILAQFDGVCLSKGLGLRIQDIPAAIWEMIPFSFVLDWVTNLSRYISALAADLSDDGAAQWLTYRRERSVTRTVTSCAVASGWAITKRCADTDSVSIVSTRREPTILAGYRAFSFSGNLNRVPILAAISLILQKLLKG